MMGNLKSIARGLARIVSPWETRHVIVPKIPLPLVLKGSSIGELLYLETRDQWSVLRVFLETEPGHSGVTCD